MIQHRILVVLLVVLLATSALAGGAQTPASSDIPAEEELAGLQGTVWRYYAPAGSIKGAGVITLDEATPLSSVAGTTQLRSISVVVREFDSAENAASAFERISAGGEALFSGGTQDITSKDLPDVGSQAKLVRIDHSGEGSDVWLEYVFVQRDRYVFFVSADGSVWNAVPGSNEVDTSLPTVEIATAVADNGEQSPDEPVFMEDGTSTGALWGFMPPADDPLLRGLVPVHDNILYPAPGA